MEDEFARRLQTSQSLRASSPSRLFGSPALHSKVNSKVNFVIPFSRASHDVFERLRAATQVDPIDDRRFRLVQISGVMQDKQRIALDRPADINHFPRLREIEVLFERMRHRDAGGVVDDDSPSHSVSMLDNQHNRFGKS